MGSVPTNFIFPSFKTTHTTLFWFLGDTQGARFYDKHGTTLHLFVILFPVQYREKRFALETRESFLITPRPEFLSENAITN